MEIPEFRKRLLKIDEQLLDLHSLISELLCDVVEPDPRSPTLREETPAFAGASWTCKNCQHQNHVSMKACVMCKTPRS